jgi:hypothetical protein
MTCSTTSVMPSPRVLRKFSIRASWKPADAPYFQIADVSEMT